MLHLDGFEQYANESNMALALSRADYTVVGIWGSVSGRGRSSRGIAGASAAVVRAFKWTTDKLSVGFAASFTGRGAMASIKVGSTDVTFWINPDSGLPNLNNIVGGALPVKNQFYYYELEMDRSTGACALYINGKYDCAINLGGISGEDVQVRLGFRAVLEYRPGVTPVPSDNSAKTFDDFYVRGDQRLGPIMITTRFPSLDMKADWFKAGEQPTHAGTLALSPPQPLDNYVASDQIGQEDRFTSNQQLQNTNPVIATGLVVLARKSPTLNARLGVFMGGTVSDRSAARTVESEWRTQFVCFERVNSDSIESIQNSQFGINVVAP